MTLLTGQIIPRQDTAANWASENPVLASFEEGFETDTGLSKRGDAVTHWNDLPYEGNESDESRVITTGQLVTVISDDATVAEALYYISGEGTFTSPLTNFNNIALSSSGTQRFVAFYGNTSSTVTKVEGSEGALAVMPNTPADTVLLGYILVTDAAVSETPDLSGYLLRADKATASDVSTGTNDDKYVTPLSVAGKASKTGTETITNKRIQKRRVVVTQSATPTINTDNGDIFSITGLAQAITSFTTNLSGTPVAGEMMMIQITDNGTARAITWGASFQSTTISLPTTTVISTMLRVLFQWNSVASKWDCIATA